MLIDTQSLDFRLLNAYQRDFPLVPRPFEVLAEELSVTEDEVLAAMKRLSTAGSISRVGAVFAPNRVGASTLAALSVPEGRLEEVAARVSSRPEVNHNYRREHRFNLWFVAAAPSRERLAVVLDEIALEAGRPVLSLPLEQEYHIDLGFDLAERGAHRLSGPAGPACELPAFGEKLIAALQGGLPLVSRPFAAVAAAAGLHEGMALSMIGELIAAGLIKRFGVVVRHHELGFRANAMCVWDVPDEEVDTLGALLAREEAVTLCYRRRRGAAERAAGWPYNLFCMIHGRERAEVERQHADLWASMSLKPSPSLPSSSRLRFSRLRL